MERYRQLWTVPATLLTLTGVWVALRTWALSDVAVVFLAIAMVATLWLWAFRELADAWAWSLPRGTLLAVWLVGAAGLTVAAGPAGTAAMVTLGVLSPPVLRVALRGREPGREPELCLVRLPDVDRLADLELCRLWRETYLDLVETTLPHRRLELVRLRERALQELERRHPDAILAWLASRPSAAGDPSRYLNRPRSTK